MIKETESKTSAGDLSSWLYGMGCGWLGVGISNMIISPSTLSFVIHALIGIVLIAVGLSQTSDSVSPETKSAHRSSSS